MKRSNNLKKLISIGVIAGLSVSTLSSNIENLANAREDITSIAELTNSAGRLSTEVIENEAGAVIRVSAHANIQNVKTTYSVDNTKSQVVSFGDLKAGEVREIQVNLDENSNTAKVLPKTSVVSDKVEFSKEIRCHKIKGNVSYEYDNGLKPSQPAKPSKPEVPGTPEVPNTPKTPEKPSVDGLLPADEEVLQALQFILDDAHKGHKIEYKKVVENKNIDLEVEYVDDDTLEDGKIVLKRAGSPTVVKIITREIYIDGVHVPKYTMLMDRIEIKQGVAKVYARGTKKVENVKPTEPTTPEQPGTEIPEQPGTETPETPGTETPETPGTETPEQPGTETPGQPGTETPEQPGTETPEQPGTETPEQPGTETPKQPGTETPETPGTEKPEQPGTETPEQPGTETPKQPGTETPETPGTETPETPGTETPEQPGTEKPDKPEFHFEIPKDAPVLDKPEFQFEVPKDAPVLEKPEFHFEVPKDAPVLEKPEFHFEVPKDAPVLEKPEFHFEIPKDAPVLEKPEFHFEVPKDAPVLEKPEAPIPPEKPSEDIDWSKKAHFIINESEKKDLYDYYGSEEVNKVLNQLFGKTSGNITIEKYKEVMSNPELKKIFDEYQLDFVFKINDPALFNKEINDYAVKNEKEINRYFIELVNQARAKEGLKPVISASDVVFKDQKVDYFIQENANTRAKEMADYGSLRYKGVKAGAHKRPDGRSWYTVYEDQNRDISNSSDFRHAYAGENAAEIHHSDKVMISTPKQAIETIFATWMASPGHRALIMEKEDNLIFAFSYRQGLKDYLYPESGSKPTVGILHVSKWINPLRYESSREKYEKFIKENPDSPYASQEYQEFLKKVLEKNK